MIPKIIHFIFGLEKDFANKPFSYIHYLAIMSAKVVNNPDLIYFHYKYEPDNLWYDKVKQHITPVKVEAKEDIFGNELKNYAHKSDIIRLEVLRKYGGIYLDADVICLNSFSSLLENECVLGIEKNVGLCNAVILASQNSEFLNIWLDNYKSFNSNEWNEHSVRLPFRLYEKFPNLINVQDEFAFFFPMYNDLTSQYLWQSEKLHLIDQMKSLWGKLKTREVKFENKTSSYMNSFYGPKWHLNKLKKSYTLHLWESLWWGKYLNNITPNYIESSESNFAKIIRDYLKIK